MNCNCWNVNKKAEDGKKVRSENTNQPAMISSDNISSLSNSVIEREYGVISGLFFRLPSANE